MISNLDKYKIDLKKLIEEGELLFMSMQAEALPEQVKQAMKLSKKEFDDFTSKLPSVSSKYQHWYSEAKAVVKFFLPDRIEDFVKLYEKPKGRKEVQYGNYVVEDYLQNLRVTRGYEKIVVVDTSAAIPQLRQQVNILKSVEKRFESSLFDIKQLVQADLFDSELDAARELLKNKFFRAAGAVAGVVLEKHLKQVCVNHNLSLAKKDPTINDFNEILKSNQIVDVPQWRYIQHLGDLRNLCDHNKKKEPTDTDVYDLINGVEKLTKTLF